MPLFFVLRRKGDSNPRYPYEYDSLANCWFQPLTHLSFRVTRTFRLYLKLCFFAKAGAKVQQKIELCKFFRIFFAYMAYILYLCSRK